MNRSIKSLLLVAVLGLSACQTSPDLPVIGVERIQWEHVKDNCTGETCPLFNGDTLVYAKAPLLNQLIESRLAALANPESRFSPSPHLKDIERAFLQKAEPNWQNYIQAKERDRHGSIIVIEFASYLYTGGAHGEPGRGFVNYSTAENRALTLNDLILPGQEERFWQIAERAHRFWLHRHKLDIDNEYMKTWPFQRTEHIALLKDRLLPKYDVYAIAPYSSGHPELLLSYDELTGIIDPRYVPKRAK